MKHFLKNCIKLGCNVKIYVPSTTNIDKPQDNILWENSSLELLSRIFGGATSTKALGCWLSQSGALVKEGVTLVISYTTQEDLEKNIDEVYDFCLKMKTELKQEAISLEVNGELYFV
jgi:hypothetical protein